MNTIYFTPLSLSQLLKEKGVKQESMFYWIFDGLTPDGTSIIYTGGGSDNENDISAFTLSELPDVFRQVFPCETAKYVKENPADMNWDMFASDYFKDPQFAWETLEKTIRELK